MIIRIVRMTFIEGKSDVFLGIFNQSKDLILGTDGCLHLELWRDLQQPDTYVTHSHWESEAALNQYREKKFFKEIWKETRVLFSEKPLVFSVERV